LSIEFKRSKLLSHGIWEIGQPVIPLATEEHTAQSCTKLEFEKPHQQERDILAKELPEYLKRRFEGVSSYIQTGIIATMTGEYSRHGAQSKNDGE
jgi:hypothetical protein